MYYSITPMYYSITSCNMFAKCIKTCMASKWHQLLKLHTSPSTTMIHDDKKKSTVAEGDSAGELGTPMLDIDLTDDIFRAMMPPLQTDSTLEDAAMMAVTSGSTTPLVKEELRCSIQLRLLSSGRDITNTSSETSGSSTPSPGLSPDEEEKRRRRRERNKEAAQRCRKRKREVADVLQMEVNQLESRNKELKSAIDKLLEEKTSLVTLLTRHDKSTQCDARLSTS